MKRSVLLSRCNPSGWVTATTMTMFSLMFVFSTPGSLAREDSGRGVKNIIIMIGDGMGYNHVAVTDMYDKGTTGSQVFEKFPFYCAMSTFPIGGGYDPVQAWSNFYYVDYNPTDSAAAATAMSTGQKTYNSAIGVIGTSAETAVRGKHAFEYAEERGMSTGVVTTVFISDATPAGFSAHNVNRYNNNGLEMLTTSTLDVIMGAGHPWFDDNNQPRADPSYNNIGGQQAWDGLVSGTLPVADADHNGLSDDAWTLIETKTQFEDLATTATPPKRVCGIARVGNTLQWYRTDERGGGPDVYRDDPPGKVPFNTGVPDLATMSRGALNVLSRNPKGFFVMIEGGAIDWACHNYQHGRLIEETIDFDRAIEAVVAWVDQNSNWDETMLIVTADHENGDIWGLNANPLFDPIQNNGVGQMPGFHYCNTYHTNELVPVFVKGSWLVGNLFRQRAINDDPVRGKYLDNTDLGQIFIGLISGALGRSCSPLINAY